MSWDRRYIKFRIEHSFDQWKLASRHRAREDTRVMHEGVRVSRLYALQLVLIQPHAAKKTTHELAHRGRIKRAETSLEVFHTVWCM